jgi:hypothetical protein
MGIGVALFLGNGCWCRLDGGSENGEENRGVDVLHHVGDSDGSRE